MLRSDPFLSVFDHCITNLFTASRTNQALPAKLPYGSSIQIHGLSGTKQLQILFRFLYGVSRKNESSLPIIYLHMSAHIDYFIIHFLHLPFSICILPHNMSNKTDILCIDFPVYQIKRNRECISDKITSCPVWFFPARYVILKLSKPEKPS